MAKTKFNPDKDEFIQKYKELESSRLMGEYHNVNNKTICKFANSIGFKNLSKNNYWKPASKEEFIMQYENLKSATKMAEFYNVCRETILSYAKRINFINQYRVSLDNEEVKMICDNYDNKTSIEIAKELNVSKSLITKVWSENNLTGKETRRYYMDFNYFNCIDSKDKAYFLGVIASDGCVYDREGHQSVLAFKFHIQEKDIIDSFLLWTKSNYVPTITENRICLQISSNTIGDDLKKYNIENRKTKTYIPVILEDELMWHYLRGFFDGDGSIYYTYKNPEKLSNWNISYCGNKSTMEMFQNFFTKYNIKSYLYKDNRKDKYTMDFYTLRIRENISKKIFINNIYRDSDNIRLNRKYEKALKFLSYYNNAVLNSNI